MFSAMVRRWLLRFFSYSTRSGFSFTSVVVRSTSHRPHPSSRTPLPRVCQVGGRAQRQDLSEDGGAIRVTGEQALTLRRRLQQCVYRYGLPEHCGTALRMERRRRRNERSGLNREQRYTRPNGTRQRRRCNPHQRPGAADNSNFLAVGSLIAMIRQNPLSVVPDSAFDCR